MSVRAKNREFLQSGEISRETSRENGSVKKCHCGDGHADSENGEMLTNMIAFWLCLRSGLNGNNC